MKKILTFLTSVCMSASMLPFSASAAEYEKYPNIADFNTKNEYYQELSDGIKDGRYFYDFDGNGKFDLTDPYLILYYNSMIATDVEEPDWEGLTLTCSFSKSCRYSFLKSYDTVERDEMLDYSVPLNNDMLENVKKYGDVNGDGIVDSKDTSVFLAAYSYNFKLGDVDLDGSVDATDASYVLEYYSKSSTSSEISKEEIQEMIRVADMNGDSVVDSSDASLILKAYAEAATSK